MSAARPKDLTAAERGEPGRVSKKDRIVAIFLSGVKDLAELAAYVQARPSYVAQVLQSEGLIEGYYDLYTSTSREPNVYARQFRNVLAFKDPAAARASVARIDELYRGFESIKDRAGQHQAMVLALTGMNRARWCGKTNEAKIFKDWLMSH
jgi:hypothetical protein